MGSCPPPLRFQRAAWIEAKPNLGRALRGAEEFIGAEVMNGAAEAWRIDHGGGTPSWMVTRIEGDELVVVAYEGRELRAAARAIVRHATRDGFTSVRFHHVTPALARLVGEFKPETVEIVSRINLNGR